MKASGNPVQSVDRTFDIMEVLSSSSYGMSLTDLSEEVKLHISTTHRLLSALVSRGYVQKDVSTGKYKLTMKLFEVGSKVLGGMNLVSLSRPFLEHLAEFTGETIHLVARHGDDVVYLYKEDTNNSIIRMASFVGLHNPMYCTAVGKSIMANLPESEARSIWDRTVITSFTPHTITDYDKLSAELVKIRAAGYAVDREEHEIGVICIASAFYDYSGSPVGALSTSFPASRVSEEQRKKFAEQIMISANGITKLLGGQIRSISGKSTL